MSIALHEMLESLFGIVTFTRECPAGTLATNTIARFLANNPQRVSFVVFNLGGNAIYIAPTNLVSTTHGIYLAPNGGSISLIWDRDFELCSHDWYCVTDVDTSAMYYLENVIQ